MYSWWYRFLVNYRFLRYDLVDTINDYINIISIITINGNNVKKGFLCLARRSI
jgi:hypothetical protein